MPNIFDGIAKLNDADLRNQIATLEEVTMANVFGQIGNTISTKAASAIGFIRKTFTGKETNVPPAVKIEDRISKKIIVLESLNRDELEKRLRSVLTDKVNSATFHFLEEPSDDDLSAEVIDLAVKNYKKEKINPNLTYAQKADVIRSRYDERMLSQMQEKLSKQTEEEKKRTEEAIQKELDAMSEERREELCRALHIEKLNGEMVRKMFASTAGVSATLIAMESAGFGAYIALTTVMHAVFTTFLGVTLPFAAYTGATTLLSVITGPVGIAVAGGVELLMLNNNKNKIIYELAAQIVWLSVTTFGHKFTPGEEELPSWLPSMERDREAREIKALHDMIQEMEKLQNELDDHKNQLADANNEKLKYRNLVREHQKRVIDAQEKYEAQRIELGKLKQERDRAKANAQVSEEDSLKLKGTVNELERQIASKDSEVSDLYLMLQSEENEINKLKKALADSEKTVALQNETIQSLDKKVESSRKDSEKKWSKKADDLKNKWTRFFRTIDFEHTVFKDVVKNYEHEEFTDIEIALRELDDAKDKRAVRDNRGKVGGGRWHVGFSTKSGYPSRIFVRDHQSAPQGKTAIVTDIVKHNDSRYSQLCR